MNDPVVLLNEICRLMQLRGENPYRIRAYEKAIHAISGREDLVERAQKKTLTELPGIGESIQETLVEYILEGKSNLRDELQKEIHPGLLELTQISGLGPKKASVLIEQLGIQTIGELEYACKENRLVSLKGFGPKAQEKILEQIHFFNLNRGFQKYADVETIGAEILKKLQSEYSGGKILETGAFRRKSEVLTEFEFLIESEKPLESLFRKFLEGVSSPIPIRLHYSNSKDLAYLWAKTTATTQHWEALGAPGTIEASTEDAFYEKLGLPWIAPELRETGDEVQLARAGLLGQILPWNGIQGVFHNHTLRSDGAHSLEQMVVAAKELGFRYLGISDHSQSAAYAQGLKEDGLLAQEQEVRQVQEKHPEIRIFWGIESDILADGSLDYPPELLKKFDFVIASIHSRFQMDREAMTQRILTAIRNPYTRFIGHPTGRLLLGRKGYDLDMEKIIAEAARHQVALELNANPSRLDLDWRWGPVMRREKAFTSVNPDAHEMQGLKDTHYGVIMARKSLIPAHQIVNTKSVSEVEQWLKRT